MTFHRPLIFIPVQTETIQTMPPDHLVSTQAPRWWPSFAAIHWMAYWVCSTLYIAYMVDLHLDGISSTTSSEARMNNVQQICGESM
jgi:hypothetical protein